MVATGNPGSSPRKTEVIDVLSGETCDDLADFPLANAGAVGANLNGTLVVCGGTYSGSYQTCYNFTNAGWQQFSSMKEKRRFAAGVMSKNKFHVFGGYDGSSLLQTSEIISMDGGVEYGPELPVAVSSHAIISINSTLSLLSGGSTDTTGSSSLTWFFDHETNVFSSGPSLLQGRRRHGSATCVDKVTKIEIPMVAGGFKGGYMRSTELLINGMWQSGTNQCKK